MLRANSEIAVEDAGTLLSRLCEHFREHGEVEHDGDRGTVRYAYGSAALSAERDRLAVEVEAANEINLSYMKMGMVEHVLAMSEAAVGEIRWVGDGVDGGLPLFFREMRVVGSERLSPHMQRIRLAGEDLGRFATEGYHVRLLFPPRGRQPLWPRLVADGRLRWPEGEDRIEHRVYTLRHVDAVAGTVDIDIVLHEGEGMPGSDFARTASPGHTVGMSGPGGGTLPESKALFLFGDETALPAIARMLEEASPETRIEAVVEVETAQDRLALAERDGVTHRYILRGGGETLSDAVRHADLGSLGADPFVWAAGEFGDFKAIRAFLRRDLKWPRDRHMAAAYWRRGVRADETRAED